MLDFPVYGRLSGLELLRARASPDQCASLLISTERYRFAVVAYDRETRQVVTRAHGMSADRVGKPTNSGQIVLVDPESRVIGMHLYDGLFKCVPIEPSGRLIEAFNARLEELKVIDIRFLYGTRQPSIAILYEDTRGNRFVRSYVIDMERKELIKGSLERTRVEEGASRLVALPSPLGGVLVIGEQSITYYGDGSAPQVLQMSPTTVTCSAMIDDDGSRILLGEYQGVLSILLVKHDGKGTVTGLAREVLGTTSTAATISYLDNSVVYVGSAFGNSQLLRLTEKANAEGSYVEVLDEFTNLGPIVDFCVVDLDQGQGQVVTCSGAAKDGSLRIVRNGIGINEQADIDLPGIKDMWSLKRNDETEFDTFLVQSYFGETRILGIEGDELQEMVIAGFDAEAQTLFTANMHGNRLVQVTPTSLRLVDSNSMELLGAIKFPEDKNASVAAGNATQVLVALRGGLLHLYELAADGASLELKGNVTMPYDISCLDISPVGADEHGGLRSSICAVGLWTDISVRILRVPSLEPVTLELLGGDTLPRSVLLAQFDETPYLLCGLGDGHLFSFTFDRDNGKLMDRKRISLGTKPIELRKFRSKDSAHVFASSDRPTVIYSSSRKLLYSNVNLPDVMHMCPFHSESFPDCLALATDEKLVIGTIDDIQKLHIRTVPLGEMPRRIAHSAASNHFAVVTSRMHDDPARGSSETHHVRFIRGGTYDAIHSVDLEDMEHGVSVAACTLRVAGAAGTAAAGDAESRALFVVGTAVADPNDAEPKRGRLLVYEIENSSDGTNKQLPRAVCETVVKGAVHDLAPFNGNFVCCVNARVLVFGLQRQSDGTLKLRELASHHGHILSLALAPIGDFIVVGDLMKSISVLQLENANANAGDADGDVSMVDTESAELRLSEIARDFNSNWITAVAALDADAYIGAENSFNLLLWKRNSDAATDDERARLLIAGEFHSGESINVFRKGSLAMRLPDTEAATVSSHIFGTVNGVLGVCVVLPAEKYTFFLKVQNALTSVVKGIGGFTHADWRSFSSDRKTVEARGFIDGDLVESFLDLDRSKMEEVAKAVDTSVEELTKAIEDVSVLS